MRGNKILKIMMSAAVMASVASGTVLAEEIEGESGEYSEIHETEENMETEAVQEEAQVRETAKRREMGPGVKAEETHEDAGESDTPQPEEERDTQPEEGEAVYVMMGKVDSLEGEGAESSEEQPEIVRLEKYGPQGMSLAKVNEVEEEETAPLYTDEDLYILAHAICGEGQCCPDDEQLYIGSVILNRRSHGAYPDSIRGVVFQRGQYACTWDGNYYREPTEANWRNARWLLENGSILPGNVVYQAGFRQGSGLYLQTRYHKYCYR